MNEFVDMPSVRMDMASYKTQEYFPMNKREWKRIRTKVAALGKKRREFAAVAWASLGVTFTSVFTLLTWMPAYKGMEQTLKFEFAWVLPAIIAAGMAGVGFAVIAFTASYLFGKSERASSAEIVEEMNEIFNPDNESARAALIPRAARLGRPMASLKKWDTDIKHHTG